MHATTTLPHPQLLADAIDFTALATTPRDVLRRAGHELGNKIMVFEVTDPDADLSTHYERLAALREELERRDAEDPEIRRLLHSYLHAEAA